MNSKQLLDAVKSHTGTASDYALAREVFKVDPNSLREMRERGLSDARALQCAELLGLDPGAVLASIHAERAKEPAVKRAWQQVAKTLRTTAAGLLVAFGLAAGTAPEPARAAHSPSMYIMSSRRGWKAWRAAAAGILALFGLSAPVMAADPWSDADVAREAAYLLLTAADWRLTLNFRKQGMPEENPILGKYPSNKRINTLIPLGMLLHVGVTHVLPARYRPAWQYVSIAIEAGAVYKSYRAGISLDF